MKASFMNLKIKAKKMADMISKLAVSWQLKVSSRYPLCWLILHEHKENCNQVANSTWNIICCYFCGRSGQPLANAAKTCLMCLWIRNIYSTILQHAELNTYISRLDFSFEMAIFNWSITHKYCRAWWYFANTSKLTNIT